MASGIDDPAFWDMFDRNLYGKTAEVLLSIFLAGGRTGAAQLPEKLQVLVSWDTFNQAAQGFLKLYRLNTVSNITEVTRRNAIQIIGDWMESGEPFNLLTTRLEPWLGAKRAERIAVTEVTRTYAAGNVSAWKATDGLVTERVFSTAEDEKVCILCGSMDGKVTGIDSNFQLSDADLQRFAEKTGADLPEKILNLARGGDLTWAIPPLHTTCRCWQRPVVSEIGFRERIRRELEQD